MKKIRMLSFAILGLASTLLFTACNSNKSGGNSNNSNPSPYYVNTAVDNSDICSSYSSTYGVPYVPVNLNGQLYCVQYSYINQYMYNTAYYNNYAYFYTSIVYQYSYGAACSTQVSVDFGGNVGYVTLCVPVQAGTTAFNSLNVVTPSVSYASACDAYYYTYGYQYVPINIGGALYCVQYDYLNAYLGNSYYYSNYNYYYSSMIYSYGTYSSCNNQVSVNFGGNFGFVNLCVNY